MQAPGSIPVVEIDQAAARETWIKLFGTRPLRSDAARARTARRPARLNIDTRGMIRSGAAGLSSTVSQLAEVGGRRRGRRVSHPTRRDELSTLESRSADDRDRRPSHSMSAVLFSTAFWKETAAPMRSSQAPTPTPGHSRCPWPSR